jgi:hypothetical protein
MRLLRFAVLLALVLVLAVGLSACQKKQSETSMTDTTSTSAESPYPVEETPPPASTNPPPSNPPRSSGGSTHTTHTGGSSSSHEARERTAQISQGTTFDVAMVTNADTRTSNIGDAVEAKLTAPLVVDGKVVAEEGATVRGNIADLQRASKSKSEDARALIKFNFNELETVGGTKRISSTVTGSEGKLAAKSTSTRDKLIIGGSTVAGAIIGKVAGHSTKSTVIGAVGGAVVGTGVVLSAKGYEVEVPPGSKVTIRVDEPVTVALR